MRGLENLERFDVSVVDHIATVTISAPPVNAQDRRFRDEIVRIFDLLGLEDNVRVIILTAAGRTFCAGADLSERGSITDEPGGYARHNRLVRASIDCVMECPKPVIAAVNGAAVGGGCVLALVCDILIVSETAFFSMPEVDHGMSGGVRFAMAAFSPSDARLMIYTGKRIEGPELLRMNVASACVKPEALQSEAMGIARAIASKVPLAVEASKRSFALTEELSIRDGYRYEQSQTAALAKTEDALEAQAARREKRAPIFNRR